MALDGTAKRRIVRVSVARGSGTERGTGFQVGPRELLTAFHVVGDRATGQLYDGARAGAIVVEIDKAEPAQRRTTSASVVPGAFDRQRDWALLECADTVTDTAFALRKAPIGYRVPWDTFGYSDSEPDLGMVYGGTITSPDDIELQLFCREAREGSRVPGLSGAPVIVDGFAVAMIISASDPERCGYPRQGALFAITIDAIALRCKQLALEQWTPPFVPQVEAELTAPTVIPLLPAAGTILAFPDVSMTERARLPPLVADGILRRGPRRAVKVLTPLAPQLLQPRADQILYLTASVWIDDAAAAMLEDAILASAPRTAIGLNASTPALGIRYVHRAGYRTASDPGWLLQMRSLPEHAGERRAADFVLLARAELARYYACTDDELDREYALDDFASPLILVVPPSLPPEAGVIALHDAFPRVQLLLLCGPGGLDELQRRFPAAKVVEPPLLPAQEARAEEHYTRALGDMARCYEALEVRVRGP